MNSITNIKTPYFKVSAIEEANEVVKTVRTQDIYAEPNNIRFLPSGCLEANNHRLPLADIGFLTLCHYLNIPVQYGLRIPIDLLTTNVNRLLKESNKEILIRAQLWPGMKLMAITCVTNGKYRAFPYRNLLSSLSSVQKDLEYNVERIIISPSLFRAEFTIGKELDVLPNDFYKFGSEIIASENAMFPSVSIRSYVFRLVCTNGLILPDVYDHFSFKPMQNVQTNDLTCLLGSAIKSTWSSSKNIKEVLNSVAQKKLSEGHSFWLYQHIRNKVPADTLKNFQPEVLSNKTYYDVLNEVTAQSHNTVNIMQQRYFQLLGGELLKLLITKN